MNAPIRHSSLGLSHLMLALATICLGCAVNAFLIGYVTGGLPLLAGLLLTFVGLSLLRQRNQLSL